MGSSHQGKRHTKKYFKNQKINSSMISKYKNYTVLNLQNPKNIQQLKIYRGWPVKNGRVFLILLTFYKVPVKHGHV